MNLYVGGGEYANVEPITDDFVPELDQNEPVIIEQDEVAPDLPSPSFPDVDFGAIVELIPEAARKTVFAVLAVLSLLGGIAVGVVTSLASSELISQPGAFTALTVLGIVSSILTALTGALGFASTRVETHLVVPWGG